MHRKLIQRIAPATLPLLFVGCHGCHKVDSTLPSRSSVEAAPNVQRPTMTADHAASDPESADHVAGSPPMPTDDVPAPGSPLADGEDGDDAELTNARNRGATTTDRAGVVSSAVQKAQNLRRSATDDEMAGRPVAAYTTLLRAWSILRPHEADPTAKETAGLLRGDLERLGKTLRRQSPNSNAFSNETTILVQ